MQQKTINTIILKLKEHYPEAKTTLNFATPFQLLVATILSAQTTDIQVNKITASLFKKFKNAFDFARLTVEELESLLKSCGLYKNKTRYIIATSKIIAAKYRGNVPETVEELIALPGIGRKTANVILSSAFGLPAIAVDTHVFRVSRRLGLAAGKNPAETERILQKKIPKSLWGLFSHLLIEHGRNYCVARNPRCSQCFLNTLCKREIY